MEEVVIINLEQVINDSEVGWVLGMGKAPFKDENLEIAFYNGVFGNANNPRHHHNLSTERLLIIKGGMTLEIKGEEQKIGPMQIISIPPGIEHCIISYEPDTIAFNLRNSKQGAVGHLPQDR